MERRLLERYAGLWVCSRECTQETHKRRRHPGWTVTCVVCESKFEAKRSNATYCSARCRQRARRQHLGERGRNETRRNRHARLMEKRRGR